ncbi:ankyrin repeat protein [Pochonia chlamydosporia 170]|uniref:Ankyrin repeat protein n=1 Tax=Pochonia chlamydosporia 170 TaxID=1380566 RepID=A0A179FX41_METCM|nr:ankyrin repeat protein [Pochonia chlamydosporia 170]OAQ70204.1 ankyrin repeat protein [Pochonia chlamydosporia 170]
MDAQNAAESDQTRPAGASSQQRPASEAENKPEAAVKTESPGKDPKSKTAAADETSSSTARPDDAPEDRDSDAETIVLPGKDGHSPSKARKVRQEDKSESDGDAAKGKPANGNGKHSHEADRAATSASGNRLVEGARKKRPSVSAESSLDKDRRYRAKEAASSGLSSAPTSPPHNQQNQHHHPSRRRRSDAAAAAAAAVSSQSDSEHSHKTSSKSSLREKLKSGERLVPHKRKAPKVESDEEADLRKARRQRTTSAGLDSGRHRDPRSSHSKHDGRNRSASPPPRQHRRSISTQLPSQSSNGLGTKKRRLPPPLQSTDYQSDDSSTGGSPHPRSSKLRSLATPASAEANVSPAKMGPHKKHLDAHGQTLLARACARGEYDGAKQRLHERPEDLNVADYAGNTPLQIAAINGCEDIVKLLIDAGCNLDCVNYDKDTPLLDAVDNGHLGVVKLLLDAGVNPRKANVNGEEPIDRVSDDTDNAEEIRAALSEAKKRQGDRRRTSEDRHSHTDPHDARDSHAPDSPRHSPAATTSAATSRRSGTVRSTKTRNDLLYMPLDDKTLRQAAGRGDEETVARILQVKEGYDDPESMVAAARGGHDLVIQLLLGLGGANADPGPVASLPAEFATPILAAIGQENIKVVELLLEQQGFDPTRRFKGETYYEIARRRQGTNWKDEETKLKEAYDEYKRSHKDSLKTKSPGGRRDKFSRRDDAKEESKSSRRRMSSPSRDVELKKRPSKLVSPRDKRRSNSINNRGDEEFQKKGPGRPKKEHSAISDRELSPAVSHKGHKAKRAESDVAALSSEGEAAKPRRKLVSKGELRGERDKHKRISSQNEPSSPRDSRSDDAPEKTRLSEKYHDRAKALKRDESRDRPSGDGSTKRHRTSVTPDRPSDVDKDGNEIPVKRRRLDAEGQEPRQKRVFSEDGRPRKSSSSRDASSKASSTSGQKERNDGKKRDVDSRASGQPASGEKSIHVKSEDIDVPMPDLEPAKDTESLQSDVAKQVEEAEQARLKKEAEEEAARKKKEEEKEEEERKRIEAEESKKREEEAARKAEEEKKRQEEEEARKRKAQEERERREAAQREEEEKRKRLEEEKRKKEEEERRQREEDERLHREQLEREAAEAARRQREEEERKERERRERAHREEMERKRAAREAEQRRIREEQERARLEKLPPLLRWLDMHPGPKTGAIAEHFKHMLGVRYDTIRPAATGTVEGREQWLLNTNVALLLGEKDLDLSRYTAWERAPVNRLAKITIWRTEWPRYSLLSEKLWDLGRQLPGYYGEADPSNLDFYTKQQLKTAAWEKFAALDMFFVKLSDFLYTVPNIPHLRNLRIAVEYRELLENESQLIGWKSTQKWKQDPGTERFHGFAPRNKYYVNGLSVGEDLPTTHQTSKTPFPEKRVPRRGLVQVFPDDPDYERICLEQGLEPLVKGLQTPSLPNGVHSSPTMQTMVTPSKPSINGTNGHANGTKLNGIHGNSA